MNLNRKWIREKGTVAALLLLVLSLTVSAVSFAAEETEP